MTLPPSSSAAFFLSSSLPSFSPSILVPSLWIRQDLSHQVATGCVAHLGRDPSPQLYRLAPPCSEIRFFGVVQNPSISTFGCLGISQRFSSKPVWVVLCLCLLRVALAILHSDSATVLVLPCESQTLFQRALPFWSHGLSAIPVL